MSEELHESEQIVREYTELWNDRDYSRIPDLVSESFTAILPDREFHGHDGLEEWIDEVTSAFPDLEAEPLATVAAGETVMGEAVISGTHEGEFRGIPPTGEEVEMRLASKFRVEDDELVEQRQYIDRQELAEQLGVADD